MRVKIKKGVAKGQVTAPPSKSMAHRMMICAGLSEGTCKVQGIAPSMDVLATIDCLEAIGAKCKLEGDVLNITGVDIRRTQPQGILKCRESGSTLRFMIPICLASGMEATLEGSKRLMERPLNIYEQICLEKNMTFEQNEGKVRVIGPIQSGEFEMLGNVSSQFISGLLFVLPLLDGDSKIKLIPPVESRSYIDMTIEALSCFGVEANWIDENTIGIKGNQKYQAKETYVEGDYSNAAFFEALNVLGGQVEVTGLKEDSIQGDKAYIEMFKALNVGTPELDISNCPDLGPILFAVAGAKNGAKFTGTARLKIKESDRGQTMAQELSKYGIKVTVLDDDIIVEPGEVKIPTGHIDGHNDHRIVMANAVLMTLIGGTIDGAQAVSKSFPDFFEKLQSLGIGVEQIED